jgi:Peptidase A4 family
MVGLVLMATTVTGLVARQADAASNGATGVIDTHRVVGFLRSARIVPLRITLFSATPRLLPSTGGKVDLLAIVTGAQTCRFTSARAHLSKSVSCSKGSRRIVVHIPKNSSTSSHTFRFVLAAAGGRTTKRKSLSVVEEGQPASTKSTTPPGWSAPMITLDPSNQTVSPGAVATLEAGATGTPTPSVQWQISTNGGATWGPFAGATSAPYSFRAETSNNGDEFEAVFTNPVGSATTTAATLSVDAAPAVTAQPTDDTALENTTAAFFAAATGSPTPMVQWEISTDSGASWQPVVGATSSCYSFSASSSANGNQYEAVFTNTAGSTTTDAAELTVSTGPATSQNWSGYVATDPCAKFDSVSASWTVPTVSCSSGVQYSSEWVGIDGDTSQTVEQDGTEGDCSGSSASYDAWYEMYGDQNVNGGDEVELNPLYYPVSPGDVIDASVNESNGVWTLALADPSESPPWNYSTMIDFASASQSSAEWIVERPELCDPSCSLTALADFGNVAISDAQAATIGSPTSILAFSSSELNMVSNSGSTLLDESGALDPSGENFTVTWEAEGP